MFLNNPVIRNGRNKKIIIDRPKRLMGAPFSGQCLHSPEKFSFSSPVRINFSFTVWRPRIFSQMADLGVIDSGDKEIAVTIRTHGDLAMLVPAGTQCGFD